VTFATWLALSIAALGVLPLLAHRFRRRHAREISFAANSLIAATPIETRQRAKIDDRPLLALRLLLVLLVALLGASPFVSCSRLTVSRTSGASVAVVLIVDDSMSMRARANAETRFEKAKGGAREILAAMRDGDAVSVIAAGAPSRLLVSTTSSIASAKVAIDAMSASDRPTDLEGAFSLARVALQQLPHTDKKVIVLSDLSDGHSGAELPTVEGAAVIVPLTELVHPIDDCAVLSAHRRGTQAVVEVACNKPTLGAKLAVSLVSASGTVLAHSTPPPFQERTVVTLDLPSAVAKVRIDPNDAIREDDELPLVTAGAPKPIALVVDPATASVETGGATVVEQALRALHPAEAIKPLATLPDDERDLEGHSGLVIDDPQGFTPEQRRAVKSMLDRGGAVLLMLGPRSGTAPIGATFEPILQQQPRWMASSVKGIDEPSAEGLLGEGASGLVDLNAKNRTVIGYEDAKAMTVLLQWKDKEPYLLRRTVGRGDAWVLTLPAAVDASDLALSTGFVGILAAWSESAHQSSGSTSLEMGQSWSVSNVGAVESAGGKADIKREAAVFRITPSLIGVHTLTIDGKAEMRLATVSRAELDTRPRLLPVVKDATASSARQVRIDASPYVAGLLLLGLLAENLALLLRRRSDAAAQST
jgi:Mg-chelatase subunit ChlD